MPGRRGRGAGRGAKRGAARGLHSDFTAAGTDAVVGGVEHAELPRGDALQGRVAGDEQVAAWQALHVAWTRRFGVAYLAQHGALGGAVPRVGGDEVEGGESELLAVDAVGIGRARHVEGVGGYVLVRYEPRSASEPQPFALPDGVKPMAAVVAQPLAGVGIDDVAALLAQECAQVVGVMDAPEETESLAVAAVGCGQLQEVGLSAHLGFVQVANGKEHFAHLPVVGLREKIALVLHGVGRGGRATAGRRARAAPGHSGLWLCGRRHGLLLGERLRT